MPKDDEELDIDIGGNFEINKTYDIGLGLMVAVVIVMIFLHYMLKAVLEKI